MKTMKTTNTQITVKNFALLCFSAAFSTWQMGVIYFSGTALSLWGRTPIAVDQSIMTIIIAAGYLLSIVTICLVPRFMVIVQRLVFFIALLAMVGIIISSNPVTSLGFFYITAFCCVFAIGGMASIAAHLFTIETTWRDAILGMVFSGVAIALLQNDFVQFNFSIFMGCSIILVVGLLIFHLKLPAKINVPYASKLSGHRKPLIPYIGIFLMVLFPTMLLLMATSVAETVPHGVSTMFLSAAVLAVVLQVTKVKLKILSGKDYSGFLMLTPIGFVCAIMADYVPTFGLVACVLFGFSVVLSNLYLFFLATGFSLYPSRFIGAQGTALGLGLALLHSMVLEVFRNSIPLLYGIYLFISVILIIVFHFLEPHFMYIWRQEREVGGEKSELNPNADTQEQQKPEMEPMFYKVLSQQEGNLARLILEGYSEGQIAKEMNISLNTQKSYRKNLYSKLDIHSKRELFKLVQEED